MTAGQIGFQLIRKKIKPIADRRPANEHGRRRGQFRVAIAHPNERQPHGWFADGRRAVIGRGRLNFTPVSAHHHKFGQGVDRQSEAPLDLDQDRIVGGQPTPPIVEEGALRILAKMGRAGRMGRIGRPLFHQGYKEPAGIVVMGPHASATGDTRMVRGTVPGGKPGRAHQWCR